MSTMISGRVVSEVRHEDLLALVDLYSLVRERAFGRRWAGLPDFDDVVKRCDRQERSEGTAWRALAVAQLHESHFGGDPDLSVYAAAFQLGLVPTTTEETCSSECAVLWSWRDQQRELEALR